MPPVPGLRGPWPVRTAKRLAFEVLRAPGVRALVRRMPPAVRRRLPRSVLAKVPVVGRIEVEFPGPRRIALVSDGRDWIASSLHWFGPGEFEPETLTVVLELLPRVGTVVDVGASTGLYSLLAATDPARRVVAFEPLPDTYALLEANLRANAARHVRAERAAVGDREGNVTLYVPDGPWLAYSASTRLDFRKAARQVDAPAVTLDSYARMSGLEAVGLVKLDTEGTEDQVLRGARALLARDEPYILCEVLAGLTEDGLHAVLDPLGYHYFHLTPDGPVARDRIAGDPTYRAMNWLFVGPRRLETVVPYVVTPQGPSEARQRARRGLEGRRPQALGPQ